MSLGLLKLQSQPQASQVSIPAQSSNLKRGSSGQTAIPQTDRIAVTTPQIAEVVPAPAGADTLSVYSVEFDVNRFGAQVYRASNNPVNPAVRFTVGAVVTLGTFVGSATINKLILRASAKGRANPKVAQSARAMECTPGAARNAQKFTSRFRTVINSVAKAPRASWLWFAGGLANLAGSAVAYHDIAEWMADAVRDFLRSFQFVDTDQFTRAGDFARLSAIIEAGGLASARNQVNPRRYAKIPVSGDDIKLLAILCSTDVMGQPLDVVFSAKIAEALKKVVNAATLKDDPTTEDFNNILSATVIEVPISDPLNPEASDDELRALAVEFRQLMLKFGRSIKSNREWDTEDFIVPVAIIIERLIRVPMGVTLKRKFLSAAAAGTISGFTSDFDEDTAEMIKQLDRTVIESGDDSIWDILRDWFKTAIGLNPVSSGVVTEDRSQFMLNGKNRVDLDLGI